MLRFPSAAVCRTLALRYPLQRQLAARQLSFAAPASGGRARGFCAPAGKAATPEAPAAATPETPAAAAATPPPEEEQDEGIRTPPTMLQRRRLFVHAAIPMVAFGFVDNTVLIYAGDMIDNTMGVRFGLPTLAAAAMGQVFSDTSGVLCGGTIESIALKMNLPLPGLSMAQQRMTVTKVTSTIGGVLGVITGCCLGMCNLLFLDLGAAERAKRKEELDNIISFVMEDGKNLVQCERATLWMLDSDPDSSEPATFWTAHASGEFQLRIPADTGVVGKTLAQKKLINIQDTDNDATFNLGARRISQQQGQSDATQEPGEFRSKNMLCIPVMKADKVIAVIQLINKVKDDGAFEAQGFTKPDERLVTMLAHHVAVLFQQSEN